MTKAPRGTSSRVTRYSGQGTSLDTRDAFDKKVTQPGEEVKKYSLKQLDSDYLAAVNSGDIETAQRMVDEAAQASGTSSQAGTTTAATSGTDTDQTAEASPELTPPRQQEPENGKRSPKGFRQIDSA